MSHPSSLALVRDSNFRIFWIGQSLSWLGCVMQSVAQGWLVWTLTRSAAQLALTAVMVSLPVLLFSLLGGLTADRLDKRALLVATQGASLFPALCLGVLTACGEITAPRLMILAFLQGTLNAFEAPARHAFLAELVPRGQLSQALSLNAVSFNAARLIGPVLAGFAIARFGAASCFFINALSFLAGIGALLAVRRPQKRELQPQGRYLPCAELREGLRFVATDREIRRVLLLVALVSLLGIPFLPMLPVFADALQVGARGLGLLSACAGTGSLLAAAAMTQTAAMRKYKGLASLAGMLFAASLLVFSRSLDYRLSQLALVLAGGALVVFLTLANRFLQQSCPDGFRGRVMGAYTVALLGMAPLGSALMGWLALRMGAAGALTASSSLCLAAIVMLQGRKL